MKAGMEEKYTIGVDFGTLSGRAVLVRVSDGYEVAISEFLYPHGVLENSLPNESLKLPPDWALQVPSDYVTVLKITVPEILKASGIKPDDVIGISTDFTACTVLPVKRDGTPLCQLEEFKNNPHSYVKLWKHHSAQPHADRINTLAHSRNENWIRRYGGKISSEWEFAKALQLLEDAPSVFNAMDHWIEAADWITWQLTGNYVKNICSAGYKGIYQDGHYPSPEFLAELNPDFRYFVRDKVDQPLGQLGDRAGSLTKEAAIWTGLPEGIAVAVGNIDAHVTVAAANAVNPGQMVAIMGTSTCHVMVSDVLSEIQGMCGVVEGGIIPNQWGYEAGQSGVGDIFGWFANSFVPKKYEMLAKERQIDVHSLLSELANQKPVGADGLVALDWESGNRSTLVDHNLSGLVMGMTLATKPEDLYRALVESTAFGTRKIIEAFNSSGVPVKEFIAAGGLIKNKFVMQIYADVLKFPIHIIRSQQGPALGSAIHAAVAAGAYPDIQHAAKAMGGVEEDFYVPIASNSFIYDKLYSLYNSLYEEFGHNQMMQELRSIRDLAIVGGK
jgi:L-ribulokinase